MDHLENHISEETHGVHHRQGQVVIRIVLEDARTREKDFVVDQNQEGLAKMVLEELPVKKTLLK